ncbi:hypothetical protein ES705_18529 [subsurface metagenome]
MKKYTTLIITGLLSIGMMIFLYSCEPKVPSLIDRTAMVNRQELQLELDQLIGIAQIRMADLDKQEQLRGIIIQNALMIVQGQPFNPFGLLTAVAALYGITQGGNQITKVVKNARAKRTNNTT